MKIKAFGKRSLCLLLCMLMLLSPLALLPSFALGNAESAASTDFSDPQSESLSLAPSEILKMLYPDTVSAAEATYADKYFDTVFLYSDEISPSNISVEINGSDITVTALPHIYTANNGSEVKWLPRTAFFGEQSVSMSPADSDTYSCTITSPAADFVSVEYTCTLSLPLDFVASLSNFAYEDKLRAERISHEYEQSAADYLSYLKKLESYNNSLSAYEEYLEKKAIYDSDTEKYNRYLSALKQYNTDLSAYEKYTSAMAVYEKDKAAYEEAYSKNVSEYEEYKKYLENLQKIRNSMYALESMFITPDNGVRNLYAALQNKELVNMIEQYDSELVSLYGVKEADISDMREVSDELNELLHEYSDARDTSEQAAFEFYRDNYEEIRDKFNYLYDKMTAVLTDTIYIHVCALIEVEYKSDKEMASYKKWRIRNVLCHIYLICQVLDDSVTAPEVWSFYMESGGEYDYNFSELLGQNVILTDTNSANPEGLEWWQGEIPAKDLPKAPVKPDEVKQPTPPLEVKKPDPLAAVAKPDNAPTPVSPPNTEIEGYNIYLRAEHYLSEAVISQREMPDTPEITLTKSVCRAFASEPLDVYYAHDGTILSINAQPSEPTKPSTPRYAYTFESWETLTAQNGDSLYLPIFRKDVRTYTVSFADGDGIELYSKEYAYGELPSYEGNTPEKLSTNTKSFAFSGWSPAISPVTEDTVYRASFSESTRLYSISFEIRGKVQTLKLEYGTLPTPPAIRSELYEGGTLYTFEGWDKPFANVTEDTLYTAIYEKTELAEVSDGTAENIKIFKSSTAYVLTSSSDTIKLYSLIRRAALEGLEVHIKTPSLELTLTSPALSSLSNLGAQTLSVSKTDMGVCYRFLGVDGSSIRFSGDVWMTLPCTPEQTVNVFVLESGKKRLSCTVFSDGVEFKARFSESYLVSRYYTLTLKYGEGGAVFAPASLYPAHTPLELEFFPNAEYTVSKITVADRAGNVYTHSLGEELCMPEFDAVVTVEFEVKKYEIKFMSGGELIETRYYALGEVAEAPEIPLSFEKDGFLYTFIGWSKPLGIVMGNDTYTAKYYSVRITEASLLEPTSAFKTVMLTVVLPISLIVLGVAATVTATVIVTRKKKKKEENNKE